MSAISLLPSNPRRRIRQQAVVVYWSRCTSLKADLWRFPEWEQPNQGARPSRKTPAEGERFSRWRQDRIPSLSFRSLARFVHAEKMPVPNQ
jgi:hypothetical protein